VVVQDGDDVGPVAKLVVVYVADVRAPELVPPARREGHLPLLLHRPSRLLQAVELAVEGEDAPAGAGAEVDADLRERGVYPELPEVRILLEAPDRLHRLQGDLADPGRPAVRSVLQAFGSLLGPPLEDPVDGGGADPEVAGDGLDAPAVGVQRDHRRAAVTALGDLVVGREAAHEPKRYGLLREDALDRLTGRAAPEAHVADARDLVRVEAGVLGLEIDDEATHARRQPPALGRLGAEEALHALRLEAGGPAPQRATGGRPGLPGSLV